MNWRLEDDKEAWRVYLEDARVEMIQVDYRLTLLTYGHGHESKNRIHVIVENHCLLVNGDDVFAMHAEDALTLAPILAYAHSFIDAISAEKAGRLVVRFTCGAELRVEPDDQYEAWEIAGNAEPTEDRRSPFSFKLICMPGGKLMEFVD